MIGLVPRAVNEPATLMQDRAPEMARVNDRNRGTRIGRPPPPRISTHGADGDRRGNAMIRERKPSGSEAGQAG